MRITESKLRRIIRSVIRESEENIYAPFELESRKKPLEQFEYPEDVEHHEPQGPFGTTPEERQSFDDHPLDSARHRSRYAGRERRSHLDNRQIEDAYDSSRADGVIEFDRRFIGRKRN